MSVLLCRADARRLPLADESVHCVVTSPPYWGLRDYGCVGQIGLEPRPDCLGWATGAPCCACYVCTMVAVFREVRRVLRRDGTSWLNIGDSYVSAAPGRCSGDAMATSGLTGRGRDGKGSAGAVRDALVDRPTRDFGTLRVKNRIGIPWRVALALQADGWWLRSEVIWHKRNPMPASVTDRPPDAHEQVFLLTRSPRYFYDADAVRGERPGLGTAPTHSGRNLHSVWPIASQPWSGAHFAVMPPRLAERCVLAGTSERGVCAVCGAPWRRVTERTRTAPAPPSGWRTTGWSASCACDASDPVPAVVLDPFAGSGTVARVAVQHRRHAILCDLSAAYLAEQATARTSGVQVEMAV